MYNYAQPFPPSFQNRPRHNTPRKIRQQYNQVQNFNPNFSNTSYQSNTISSTPQQEQTNPNLSDTHEQNETRSTNDILFEIFGLKIYFDDILLVCILLFLCQEGIQDEYLFICLILLLLS